VVYRNC